MGRGAGAQLRMGAVSTSTRECFKKFGKNGIKIKFILAQNSFACMFFFIMCIFHQVFEDPSY